MISSALVAVADAAASIDPGDFRDGVAPPTSRVAVPELLERLDAESQRLTLAIDRLSRPRINLGVMGYSGEGKSRFLRSLTGLESTEIPDQDGGPATGVPSVIHSDARFSAVVEFLTQEEYLERIRRYFDSPEIRLPNPPASVGQFASSPLPALENPPRAYRHLELHHQAARDTLTWLDKAPLSIEREQIPEFVTQEDALGHPRTTFMAVRRLVLATEYPGGLPEIGVVDLPGLGDTNLTDLPLVLDSVSREIDVLLFVKKPPRDRAIWGRMDEKMIALARECLPHLPLEKRALLLLNLDTRVGSENRKQCDILARTPDLPVADVAIVDAADAEAVGAYFARIVERVESLVRITDRALVGELERQWGDTAQHVQDFLNAQSALLGEGSGLSEMWRINRTTEARRGLSRALRGRAEELARADSPVSMQARAAYAAALARAEAIVADFNDERFDDLIQDLHGSKTLAYGAALDEQRARLLSAFATLDDVYSDELERQKDELARLIIGEGHLATLVRGAGPDAWDAMLRLFRDPRTDLSPDSPLITAIEDLKSAELKHASMLQHRIRSATRLMSSHSPLYPPESLTPGYQAREAAQGKTPTPGVEEAPDLWDTNLVSSSRFVELVKVIGTYCLNEAPASDLSAGGGFPLGAGGGIRAILDRDLDDPTKAAAAVISTFITTVLDSPTASDDWQAVYGAWVAQIWVEDFEAAAERSESLKGLVTAVQSVNEALDLLGAPISEQPTPGMGVV